MTSQKNEPIAQLIKDKIWAAKKAKIKSYPCHVNRASEIGHPCERYLVYCRTSWNQRILHDAGLQFIFDLGNVFEKVVFNDLEEAGFEIIEQQRPFEWKDVGLTGHIDGKILLDGRMIPFEVKSMSPYVFDSVNSIDDMLNGKYAYLRKYPAQITSYILMDNKEYGLFIMKNKVNGQYKILDVFLDYEYAESLAKKSERINGHVKKGTLPDQSIEESICFRCPFHHLCLPDIGGVEFMEGAVVDMLDERAYLLEQLESVDYKGALSRIKAIREILKKVFADKPRVMLGDYLVSGKWKGSPGGGKYWSFEVVKMKGKS